MEQNSNLDQLQAKFQDIHIAQQIQQDIRLSAAKIGRHISIMHICGTHEYVIMKNGIREILPPNIEVISGPGCPVCVCPTSDIDVAIELSRRPNIILTTFGDMLRVPGTTQTLYEAKASGSDIRIVYGPHDAVELAQKNPEKEIVFFSIGFETTAPLPAVELSENHPTNFSIITANRLVPPAIDVLLQEPNTAIHGFILPGHVCAIIGSTVFEPFAQKYHAPMVVAGFEINDVLMSIDLLLKQIIAGTFNVENTYSRVVKAAGNVKAQEIMNRVFESRDAMWRGIGMIPNSGLYLRPEFQQFDAIRKFGIIIPSKITMPPGCLCSQVLLGKKHPQDCGHFNQDCTPIHPLGPCMVSHEGSCKIAHMFQMK